jgi:hypothetical protein
MKYFGSEEHKKNAKKASVIGLEKIAKNKKERIDNYNNNNPKKCGYCYKTLKYEKKNNMFCDSSCAAKHNNSKRILSNETKKLISEKLRKRKLTQKHKEKLTGNKNGNWKGGICRKEDRLKRICQLCGNEFNAEKITNNRLSRSRYCSNNCRNKFQSKNMIEKSKAGLLQGWSTRNVISYPEKFFMKVLNNDDIEYKHNHPVNKRDLGLNDSCNYFLDFYIEDK